MTLFSKALNSTPVKWTISVIVTLICAAVLIEFADQTTVDLLRGLDPAPVLVGFGLLIGAQIMRGGRLSVLISGRVVPSYDIYRISVLHNFLAALLPARLGESALVILLRHHLDMPVLSGTGVLLGLRLFDLLIVLATGGWAAWLAIPPDSVAAALRLPALAIASVSTVVLFALPASARVLDWLVRRLPAAGRPGKIGRDLTAAYTAAGTGRLFGLMIYSVAIWLVHYVAYWFCALAIDSKGALADVVFAGAAGALAFTLPINGVAQVGPFEAAWASAGALTDMGYATALAAAVTVHVVGLASGAVQAGLAMVIRPASPTDGD